MTLIVGRIIDDRLFIESDTKITDRSEAKSDPLVGTLKIIILHPFIALTFAGKVYFAEKALKEIYSRGRLQIQDIIEILASNNKESIIASDGNPDKETDFVLAVIENKKPRIFKISNGIIEPNLQTFWLGDKLAFSSFQRNYHALKKGDASEVDSLRNAFKSVVDDESMDTVGNFQVEVHMDEKICPNEIVFLYTNKTEISIVEPQPIHLKEANKYYTIPLGTTAGGAYGISYLVSVSPNLHGVALHFLYGNFGVLFCPQISLKGIKIKDVNGKEFVSELKDKYNLPMQGLVKLDESAIQFVDTRDIISKN
ncbi:hypothetical protein [Labilibaculum euxinus]